MAMSTKSTGAETGRSLVPGTLTIGVLMGGRSRERAVSLESGAAVAAALEGLGHTVRPCDIRPGDLTAEHLRGIDVAFLALHGEWGEDGQVQAELERLGVAYTFSGPEASRLAMNKVSAKHRFFRDGVPTPPFRVARRGDMHALRDARHHLGADLVVKPVAEGSSLGVSLCETEEAVARAAEAVWAQYDWVLIERRVRGREFTVGILGDAALPIIEIRTPGGWYDYHHKYESDRTEFVFDHGLDEGTVSRLVEAARAAHRSLGCRDLSRVDVMVSDGGELHVLEVNTLPGITSHSRVPKAAARAGIPFGCLCERVLTMALDRAAGRS